MLVKAVLLGAALLVSTPICYVAADTPQDPAPQARPAARAQDPAPKEAARGNAEAVRRVQAELDAAQRELERARRELQEVGRQLDEALDALDRTFDRPRERNCSPSRSRARELMSHFQWLRQHGHRDRAEGALARIVEQTGEDVGRLNSVAWSLMTDDETVGKFDEVALALAERMEQQAQRLNHQHLDTVALARFLNGEVERAIALQEKAIAKGGNHDEYRRRLRTYQAARVALAKAAAESAQGEPVAAAAGSKEDDE